MYKLTDDVNADIKNLLKRNAELEDVINKSIEGVNLILEGFRIGMHDRNIEITAKGLLNYLNRSKEVDNNTD